MTTIDPRDAEIAELRATVASLTERLTSVEQKVEEPLDNDVPVSRRHALRAAGVLAAGAIAGGAGVLASAAPAAAADGTFDNLTVSSTAVWPNPALSVTSSRSWVVGVNGSTSGRAMKIESSDLGVLVTAETTPLVLSPRGAAPRSRNLGNNHTQYDHGSIICDENGDLWLCTVSSTAFYTSVGFGGYWTYTPASFVKIAGTSTAGAFHPITPGRVHDSRLSAGGPGAISTGQNRRVSVGNRMLVGSTPALTDFVPWTTRAISANVTVTNTAGVGNLAINPGGDTVTHGSIINWTGSGQTIANGVTLSLNDARELTVICNGQAGAATNFIIDVLGYWL